MQTPLSSRSSASGRRSRMRGIGVPVATLMTITLALTGCSEDSEEEVAVATTSQLGSVLNDVAECAGAESSSLMGPGDDPHSFAPSSQQITEMAKADLVVVNGLGLELNMESALSNVEDDGGNLMEVGPDLDPMPMSESHGGDDGHDHEENSEGEMMDPHVWMDVSRMATAAELIGDELAEASDNDDYKDCGAEVAADLEEVDEQVQSILDTIPEDQRTLVTDHSAYNYFAEAYGFEVSDTVVPGGTTDGEPSSQELAELSELVDDEGVDMLVTSATSSNTMIQRLGEDSSVDIPLIEVYEGGLGEEGSGAESYEDAMIHNANAFAEALGGEPEQSEN